MALDQRNTKTKLQAEQEEFAIEEREFAQAVLNNNSESLFEAFGSGIQTGFSVSLESVFGATLGLKNVYSPKNALYISGSVANTKYGKYGVKFNENQKYNASQISYLIDLHSERQQTYERVGQNLSFNNGLVNAPATLAGVLVGALANPSVWVTGGIFNALKIGQLTAKGTSAMAKLARVGGAATIARTVPDGARIANTFGQYSRHMKKLYDKSLGKVWNPTGPALSYGIANAVELEATEALEKRIGLDTNLTPFAGLGFFLPGVLASFGKAAKVRGAPPKVINTEKIEDLNFVDVLYEKIPKLHESLDVFQARLAAMGSSFDLDDILAWSQDMDKLREVLKLAGVNRAIRDPSDLAKVLDELDGATLQRVHDNLFDVAQDVMERVIREFDQPIVPTTRTIQNVDNFTTQVIKQPDELIADGIEKTYKLTPFDYKHQLFGLSPEQQRGLLRSAEIISPGGKVRVPGGPLRFADDITYPAAQKHQTPFSDDLTFKTPQEPYRPFVDAKPQLKYADDLTDVSPRKLEVQYEKTDIIPLQRYKMGVGKLNIEKSSPKNLMAPLKYADDLTDVVRQTPYRPGAGELNLRPPKLRDDATEVINLPAKTDRAGEFNLGFKQERIGHESLDRKVVEALDGDDAEFNQFLKFSKKYEDLVEEEAAKIIKNLRESVPKLDEAKKVTTQPEVKSIWDDTGGKKFKDMTQTEQIAATHKISDNVATIVEEFVNCLKRG